MKKTLAFILAAVMLLSVSVVFVSAEAGKNKDTVIQAAYGTPVIDGTIDAVWATATPSSYDKYDWVAKDTTTYDAGQFRALWDEKYLYFLFEINDTTLFTPEVERANLKDWYKGDGGAVSFGGDFTSASGKSIWCIYKPNLVFANYSGENPGVFITEDTENWAKVDKNAQNDFVNLPESSRMFATTKSATGYVLEVKINLAASKNDFIKNLKLAAGEKISFDTWVYANDKTDVLERSHVYTWADQTVATNNNNTLKGTLELLAKKENNPDTGDNVAIFAAVAAVAVLGTAVIVKKKVTD